MGALTLGFKINMSSLELMVMEVMKVVVGPLMTNCYIVCQSNKCLVVDPGDEPETILRTLGNREVIGIVATHGHFDHVNGLQDLMLRVNAPFYMHRYDYELFNELNTMALQWGFSVKPLPNNPTFIDEGFRLPLNLKVIHTPGHTPGSISIIGDGFIITGDTLFSGSAGRVDLPGGDFELLRKSICRIYELPGDFVVYPGHGPETTIGDEREYNPIINIDLCR